MHRLNHAIRDESSWALLRDLTGDPPADLISAVRQRYPEVDSYSRHRVADLLRGLRVDGVDDLLIDLLADSTGSDAAALLRVITHRRVVVPTDDLVRLLAGTDTAIDALAAAGVAGHQSPDLVASLAPKVHAHLSDPRTQGPAAIALGRMHATRYSAELAAWLPQLVGHRHEMTAVALDLMGDAAVVPELRDWIIRAADPEVADLHTVLVRLTGWEPVLPINCDRSAWADAARDAWVDWNPAVPPRPRVERVTLLDTRRASLVVADGLGRIGIEDDPQVPGSLWARWSRSLCVDGDRVYGIGSTCGTCESSLHLIGWPAERAATIAAGVREALADVPAVTVELLDTIAPLLVGLRSGNFVATLVDLDMEHVTDPARAWWWRRLELRTPDDFGSDDTPESAWPGADHFQLRVPAPGPCPTFVAVMPRQSLGAATDETVAAHTTAIRAGARPAAVALAWVEERFVRMDDQERLLVGMILDGHHKLLAYAGSGVPARVLLVSRVEDCWGPPEDRTSLLSDVTGPLLAPE